jgi:hypothetical protein
MGSASPVGALREGDAVSAIAAIAIVEPVAVNFIVIARVIAKMIAKMKAGREVCLDQTVAEDQIYTLLNHACSWSLHILSQSRKIIQSNQTNASGNLVYRSQSP